MKKWVHPIPKLGPFFLSILQVRDMIEINLISNSCIFSWVLVQWWIFLKPQKLGNVLYILNGKQVEKFKFRTFPVCTDNQLILLVTGSILTGAFLSILRLVHFWWRGFQVSVILKGWNGCKMNEISRILEFKGWEYEVVYARNLNKSSKPQKGEVKKCIR